MRAGNGPVSTNQVAPKSAPASPPNSTISLIRNAISASHQPPILPVHGLTDPIVPVAALPTARSALGNLDIVVTAHVSTGVGHTVDPVGLKTEGNIIAKALS